MNSTTSLFFLLFATAFYVAQSSPQPEMKQPSSTTPVFSIRVDPPSTPMRIGSAINIMLTVTNISSKDIYLESTYTTTDVGMYSDFGYRLMKNGQEVETTFFHRKITGRNRPNDPQEVWGGSSILLPHPPGKIWVMTIDLKRLYEIKQPGEYTVVVSRFDDYSKTTVRSKTLRLNILP